MIDATEIAPPPDVVAGPKHISKAVSVSVVGTFLILSMGALYYARAFFLPVILALLLTLVVDPLVRALGRRRVPGILSVAVVVALLGGGLAGGSVLLSAPISEMISAAPKVVEKLHVRFAFLQSPLAAIADMSSAMEKVAQGGGNSPQSVVVAQSGLLTTAAGTLAGIGTTLGATLILSIFLLVSGDSLRTKLIHTVPTLSDKKRSLRVLLDIETEVSRYLLTIGGINAGVGLCVGLALAFFGLPNPIFWGFAAALLNFIPFVGSLTGQLLVFAVAIVTFPTLLQAALPPLAYLLVGVIEGSVVTPAVLGRRLELNPVAILIFLALATWMWGLVGAIIGVPLLVITKVFSAHFTSLSWLAEFLSSEIRPASIDPLTMIGKPEIVLKPATQPAE